jgi:hypothetical protein
MRLEELIQRIERARLRRSEHLVVQLVAVTKYTQQIEPLKKLLAEGQRAFGENRVQELERKAQLLADEPVEWHFIGNLQKNKINKLLRIDPFLIHSINSFELAEAVNKRAKKPVACLLEINSAREESKHGCDPAEAVELYHRIVEELPNIRLKGVMTIGAHTDEVEEIRRSFRLTYSIFEKVKKWGAQICSMGMSHDFEIAIEEGSNMVRIGSLLLSSYMEE